MAAGGTGEDLLFKVEDGIAHITFNRPEARNAFTFAMYDRLAELCRELNSDDSVRAAIVTGAGEKAFSAGTDISYFRDFTTAEDGLFYEARMERVFEAIEACRIPIIAAIAGSCTGGGAAIAVCCDLRIGTAGAQFGFPIARTLGNCLSAANLARLSALIGPARVKDLVFTARLVGAAEALGTGLLTEVVPSRAALDERSLALAQQIARHAPLTLRATKEGLRRLQTAQQRIDDADLITMCYTSADFREGMAAFLAKRAPRWRGN